MIAVSNHAQCFCRFLEDELARRYREAAPATLALLQERCEALAKELLAADGRLQACKDVAALRRAGKAAACTAASSACEQVWIAWHVPACNHVAEHITNSTTQQGPTTSSLGSTVKF
jgi:hypothetical protein